MIDQTAIIHDTAIVHESAVIGKGVEIGPFSVIGAEVEIGDNTWVGSHVVIKGPTKIGRGNKIFQHTSIGEDCQDKKYAGERTFLEIGDNNVIREKLHLPPWHHSGSIPDQGGQWQPVHGQRSRCPRLHHR